MGTIAQDQKEIRFYYNSNSSTGKKAFGYIKASNKDVLAIDVSKTKVTATQWAEIVDGLNVNVEQLIDLRHPDVVNEYGENVKLSDKHEWLHFLENQPQIFKCAVLINGDRFIQIESPSEIQKHLKPDSSGIQKN